MAVKRIGVIVLPAVLLLLAACTQVRHISGVRTSFSPVSADAGVRPDTGIQHLVLPYKAQVDEKMLEVIARVDIEMTRARPEGTIGNWVTDVMLAATREAGLRVDIAISNYGGLRMPYISPGPMTIGTLYELSPFDNLLVVVAIPGVMIDSLFQKIASEEGWPVSHGVRMTIKDKRMTSLMIHDAPVDPEKIYYVAMPDYVANGGDDMAFLASLPRVQPGRFIRDALIGQAKATAQEGGMVKAEIEGRIVIEH